MWGDNIKGGVGRENAILTNLNAIDCCQTTANEKPIYFSTNSCKLQNHTGSSKIRSLKFALLGKMHALLQDVLTCSPISNDESPEHAQMNI